MHMHLSFWLRTEFPVHENPTCTPGDTYVFVQKLVQKNTSGVLVSAQTEVVKK